MKRFELRKETALNKFIIIIIIIIIMLMELSWHTRLQYRERAKIHRGPNSMVGQTMGLTIEQYQVDFQNSSRKQMEESIAALRSTQAKRWITSKKLSQKIAKLPANITLLWREFH